MLRNGDGDGVRNGTARGGSFDWLLDERACGSSRAEGLNHGRLETSHYHIYINIPASALTYAYDGLRGMFIQLYFVHPMFSPGP